ncbi:hypothetical protein YTPLAS18_05040 [Nitrospira sp.]|nr:hypothetical protein YTPLAS18_05040 [Nitrospira sp.]
MKWRMARKLVVVLGYGGVLVALSCTRPATPLDLLSWDPNDDQRKIASYYAKEAATLRQKAALVSEQATAYGLLFGRDSEWATSARLLAEFYLSKADEQERLANQHSRR